MAKKKNRAIQYQQQYVEPNYDFSSCSMTPVVTDLVPSGEAVKNTPKVLYTPEVKAQIDFIVKKQPLEVGWLGLVEEVGDDYLITDIYVPEQEVHGAETDISTTAMADLAMELIEQDKDTSKLYYWGHSHVNMDVCPSSQDEDQVDEYLKDMPIFIRGIYNKRGDSKVDVYDVEAKKVYQCVTDEVLPFVMPEPNKQHLEQLLNKNVKRQTYAWQGNFKNKNKNKVVVSQTGLHHNDIYDDFFYEDYYAEDIPVTRQSFIGVERFLKVDKPLSPLELAQVKDDLKLGAVNRADVVRLSAQKLISPAVTQELLSSSPTSFSEEEVADLEQAFYGQEFGEDTLQLLKNHNFITSHDFNAITQL